MILDEKSDVISETALLSEAALSEDWNRPEEELTNGYSRPLNSAAADPIVPGGCAAWNRGADFVKLLVPTLRAGTRSLTGRRELFNQATLA